MPTGSGTTRNPDTCTLRGTRESIPLPPSENLIFHWNPIHSLQPWKTTPRVLIPIPPPDRPPKQAQMSMVPGTVTCDVKNRLIIVPEEETDTVFHETGISGTPEGPIRAHFEPGLVQPLFWPPGTFSVGENGGSRPDRSGITSPAGVSSTSPFPLRRTAPLHN